LNYKLKFCFSKAVSWSK